MKRWIRLVLEFYFTIGVPVLYLVGLALIVYGRRYSASQFWQICGLIFAFGGLGLWLIAYFSLGKNFGVLPRTQHRTYTGIYRHFKHPMYIGIIFTYFGLALASQSYAGLLFTLFILTPVLIIRAKVEEKRLVE